MYTALKFARAHREQRREKAVQLERERLERRLNKLKARLDKEVRAHQQQLKEISAGAGAGPYEQIVIPIPEQVPSTSTSAAAAAAAAINFGFKDPPVKRINYATQDTDSEDDDENEFGHVRLASASASAPPASGVNRTLHFLSASPVAGGSVGSSCSNMSQVNITSPVFCARSVSASMRGHDRTRGSVTYSDCSGALDINGRWNGNEISTISGSHVNDADAGERAAADTNTSKSKVEDKAKVSSANKKSRLVKFLLQKPKLNPSQTRLTANMIGTFIILSGLLAAILGFLANADFRYISPVIMTVGFFMVVVGFVVIFLGEIAILCYTDAVNKLLSLIGNNKNGSVVPKLETDVEKMDTELEVETENPTRNEDLKNRGVPGPK